MGRFNKLIIGFSYLKSIRRILFISFCWLSFICFFTYTSLLHELLKAGGDFLSLFHAQQSEYISLFVNVGIVMMLVMDTSVKSFTKKRFICPFIAIALCVFIKAHCDLVISEKLMNYIYPINSECLSVVVYIIFLINVFILKVNVLITESVSTKKEL